MTDDELQAIRARCEAAADGPWRAVPFEAIWVVEVGPADDPSMCYDLFEDPSPPTCRFIAAARADVPALLAEVARLRAALAASVDREACARMVEAAEPWIGQEWAKSLGDEVRNLGKEARP